MTKRIAWLVPFPIKGSGGHRTIFSHIQNLINHGYDCDVYIGDEERKCLQPHILKEIITDYFGSCSAGFYPGYQTNGYYDMAVATVWWTASIVAAQVNAARKVYFIQDYEPYFYPMGDEYISAENSYALELIPITIGRWLAHLMATQYHKKAAYFNFTADRTVYTPLNSIRKEKSICFIYQPEKPRRCPTVGCEALAIVKHHCPDVHIYTYGSTTPPQFSFEHTHLGILSLSECNELYNRCQVGLCLCSSNPSRIPFEMMAAGLPVVDFFDDNTIYDFPNGGILLAHKTPGAIASAIIKILRSNNLQCSMRTIALDFMTKRNADLEFDQFLDIIERITKSQQLKTGKILPLYSESPHSSHLSLPNETLTKNYISEKTEEKNNQSTKTENNMKTIKYWLANNRISRLLKVLIRGYY